MLRHAKLCYARQCYASYSMLAMLATLRYATLCYATHATQAAVTNDFQAKRQARAFKSQDSGKTFDIIRNGRSLKERVI